MKIFESFNFDIIIILILISSIVSGLYFNLYRQGKRTISFIIPFIILYFSFNPILNNIKNISIINDPIIGIINFFKIETYRESTYALIIYFGLYIALNLIIKLVYSLFRVPVQKRVLSKPSALSKLLSSFLGLLHGYVLVLLIMFVLNPLITINYEKPITRFITSTSNDVITISNYNRLKNINIISYESYENSINQLTGREALDNYNRILDEFDGFLELENEFINEIIPVLSNDSTNLIDKNNMLDSYYSNRLIILAHEKGKPIVNRLREINAFIEKRYAFLKAYYNLSDYSYPTLSTYLINSEELILEDITKLQFRDELINIVNIFKNYNESRSVFLDLLEYEPVDIYTDVGYFEKELNTNTEKFIISFNNKFPQKDTILLKDLDMIFQGYLKSKDKIDSMNPHMSLSTKLTLESRFSYYFIDVNIKNNPLYWSFIVDSITNLDEKSNSLYSEYVFYINLSNEVNLNDFTKEEFIKIVTNLDSLVDKGLLTKDEASKYFANLFSNKNKVFFGLVDDQLKTEIRNIESEYISEEILMELK